MEKKEVEVSTTVSDTPAYSCVEKFFNIDDKNCFNIQQFVYNLESGQTFNLVEVKKYISNYRVAEQIIENSDLFVQNLLASKDKILDGIYKMENNLKTMSSIEIVNVNFIDLSDLLNFKHPNQKAHYTLQQGFCKNGKSSCPKILFNKFPELKAGQKFFVNTPYILKIKSHSALNSADKPPFIVVPKIMKPCGLVISTFTIDPSDEGLLRLTFIALDDIKEDTKVVVNFEAYGVDMCHERLDKFIINSNDPQSHEIQIIKAKDKQKINESRYTWNLRVVTDNIKGNVYMKTDGSNQKYLNLPVTGYQVKRSQYKIDHSKEYALEIERNNILFTSRRRESKLKNVFSIPGLYSKGEYIPPQLFRFNHFLLGVEENAFGITLLNGKKYRLTSQLSKKSSEMFMKLALMNGNDRDLNDLDHMDSGLKILKKSFEQINKSLELLNTFWIGIASSSFYSKLNDKQKIATIKLFDCYQDEPSINLSNPNFTFEKFLERIEQFCENEREEELAFKRMKHFKKPLSARIMNSIENILKHTNVTLNDKQNIGSNNNDDSSTDVIFEDNTIIKTTSVEKNQPTSTTKFEVNENKDTDDNKKTSNAALIEDSMEEDNCTEKEDPTLQNPSKKQKLSL